MSERALVVDIRLPTGRYHGDPEWPPSPFRVFQALVAGAYGCRWAAEPDQPKEAAFRWLEAQAPPTIVTPRAAQGCRTVYCVPNNDLDVVVRRAIRRRQVLDPHLATLKSGIRERKSARPVIFCPDTPLLYVWPFDGDDGHGQSLVALAGRLYQLGRGVDPAYARAEVLTWEEAAARLTAHGGPIHRPTPGGVGGTPLRCATPGSLDSLHKRHQACRARQHDGLFRQAPPAYFRTVNYDCPPVRLQFRLAPVTGSRPFQALPLREVAGFVVELRELAAARLAGALPSRAAEIARVVIGRGATEADRGRRIRFLPLPSIGSPYADRAVRRIVVEVPPTCPLGADDIAWALSNLEVGGRLLRQMQDDGMARHCGLDQKAGACLWQTITPALLSIAPRSGRLTGRGRLQVEAAVAQAARQALRQADLPGAQIRVQKEPFCSQGERAEAFHRPAYLQARQPWHLEITFPQPLPGPLVIGDGRFVGLGLLYPVDPRSPGRPTVARYRLSGPHLPPLTAAVVIADLARRAALSQFGRLYEGGRSALLSGRSDGGSPQRGHRHAHYLCTDEDGDGHIDHLTVWAPAGLPHPEQSALRALSRLFGPGGSAEVHLTLLGMASPSNAPGLAQSLIGPARVWRSLTPFVLTRHPRCHRDGRPRCDHHGRQVDGPEAQLLLELRRRHHPPPRAVAALACPSLAGAQWLDFASRRPTGNGAACGEGMGFRLTFQRPIAGPLALGYGCHFGLGLFVPEQ